MRRQRSIILFSVLLVSFTIIFSSIAFFLNSSAPFQPFITIGVYSAEGLHGYIPNANFTVVPGQTLNWYLLVTNLMGTVQYIRMIALIGNLTTPSPNATTPYT